LPHFVAVGFQSMNEVTLIRMQRRSELAIATTDVDNQAAFDVTGLQNLPGLPVVTARSGRTNR
jgi:hypothetical protein